MNYLWILFGLFLIYIVHTARKKQLADEQNENDTLKATQESVKDYDVKLAQSFQNEVKNLDDTAINKAINTDEEIVSNYKKIRNFQYDSLQERITAYSNFIQNENYANGEKKGLIIHLLNTHQAEWEREKCNSIVKIFIANTNIDSTYRFDILFIFCKKYFEDAVVPSKADFNLLSQAEVEHLLNTIIENEKIKSQENDQIHSIFKSDKTSRQKMEDLKYFIANENISYDSRCQAFKKFNIELNLTYKQWLTSIKFFIENNEISITLKTNIINFLITHRLLSTSLDAQYVCTLPISEIENLINQNIINQEDWESDQLELKYNREKNYLDQNERNAKSEARSKVFRAKSEAERNLRKAEEDVRMGWTGAEQRLVLAQIEAGHARAAYAQIIGI